MSAVATRSSECKRSVSFRRERRLNAVIAGYLEAAQTGRAPDRDELLERHWDLSDGLISFFADEDRVKHVAGLPAPLFAEPSPVYPGRSLAELAAGRRFGEFELLNLIATGGMGVVYKARHNRLNRIVALKTIDPGLIRPMDEVVRRLRAEARVVAALDHPHIVPLYDIGEQDGYPYLILKHIAGGDLERHLPRLRANPREVARLMAKVARHGAPRAPPGRLASRPEALQHFTRFTRRASRDGFRSRQVHGDRERFVANRSDSRNAFVHGSRASLCAGVI